MYGILLVLSRCCFHHLVENSILYKKDIPVQHFCIGPILFSENKIIRSVVGGKVDGQILSGTRSEKPKILFGTRMRNGKIYLALNYSFEKFHLAVKGLRERSQPKPKFSSQPANDRERSRSTDHENKRRRCSPSAQ